MGKRRVPPSSPSEDSDYSISYDEDSGSEYVNSADESDVEVSSLDRLSDRGGGRKGKGKAKAKPKPKKSKSQPAAAPAPPRRTTRHSSRISTEEATARVPVPRVTKRPAASKGSTSKDAPSPPGPSDMTPAELDEAIAEAKASIARLEKKGKTDTSYYRDEVEELKALEEAKEALLEGHRDELSYDPCATEEEKRAVHQAKIDLEKVAPRRVKPGSAAAAGQVAISTRTPGKRAPPANPRNRLVRDVVEMEEVELTPEMYDTILSKKPLWQLANEFKSGEPFPEPDADQTKLHRPVSGNTSEFCRGNPMQAMLAHITMLLSLYRTKMPQLGTDQGFGENGGPFYSCGKTCVAPPKDRRKHSEITVKGYTQISKAMEQVIECWTHWFIMGCLPTMWLRLKGGATTGTADAAKTVYEANELVQELFDWILANNPKYAEAGITARQYRDTITLKARRASEGEVIEFKGNGSYRLSEPQVFIACCNVDQLKLVHQEADSVGKANKLAAAGQPSGMPWADIMAGRVKKGDANTNPYLPYCYDVAQLALPPSERDGRARILPALAATFDENELNRSATGREAKENMLYGVDAKGATKLLEALNRGMGYDPDPPAHGDGAVGGSGSGSDSDSDSDADSVATVLGYDAEERKRAAKAAAKKKKEAKEAAKEAFSKNFHSLRSLFSHVINYTATPTDNVYKRDSTTGAQIVPKMIEMVPSNRYIGYPGFRFTQVIAPHCHRHIETVQLPDRTQMDRVNKTHVIPAVLKELVGIEVDLEKETDHGLPEQWSLRYCPKTGKPIAAAKRGHEGSEIVGPGGRSVTFARAKEAINNAHEASNVKTVEKFWYEDGNNANLLLRDAEENRAAYPEGYRNMLMISNHTKTEVMKDNWNRTLLGLIHSEQGDRSYDPRQLVSDLVIVVWDHKYVRASWVRGRGIDEDCLREAADWLTDTGGDTNNPTAKASAMKFAADIIWGDEGAAAAAESDEDDESDEDEDEGPVEIEFGSLKTSVSNINYLFTLLWKYKELNEAACAKRGEGAFLKILTLAGEICSRSVRMKSHDKHKFVLTDMLFLFNANPSKPITLHVVAALQAIGRLCTLVPDPSKAPPIKLWTTRSNWAFLSHWMAVIDEIAPLHEHLEEDETLDACLSRVLKTEPKDDEDFPALRKHFMAPTGEGKQGAKHHAKMDHQSKPAKETFTEYHDHAEAMDIVPESVAVEDKTKEMTEQHIANCAKAAAVKLGNIHKVDADDELEDGEGEEGEVLKATMGPPTLPGYESVATPKRAKIKFPKKKKVKVMAAGKRGRVEDIATIDHKFTERCIAIAFTCIADLEKLHQGFPSDATAANLDDRTLIELWANWYGYFLHINYGARGPDAKNGRHGITTTNTRSKYFAGIKNLCFTPHGRRIFAKFADLPQEDTPAERERIKELCALYVATTDLAEPEKAVKNHTTYLFKAQSSLFPHVAYGLKEWLVKTPPPPQKKLEKGASHKRARTAGGTSTADAEMADASDASDGE